MPKPANPAPGSDRPSAAPADELAASNDVLLPTVVSIVDESLVIVLTTGTVVTADDDVELSSSDEEDEEEDDSVSDDDELLSVVVMELSPVLDAEPLAVTLAVAVEKIPMAAREVPEAEGSAGKV